MPRGLPIHGEIGPDLAEPDVGHLQCLVEDIKSGAAHVLTSSRVVLGPPALVPAFVHHVFDFHGRSRRWICRRSQVE
jgi:hypothetical protein